MKPQRRKQYLQEMGITLWRPHTALPGAKSSALIRRRLSDSKAAGLEPSAGIEQPRKRRVQSAASILDEQAVPKPTRQAGRSAPSVTDLATPAPVRDGDEPATDRDRTQERVSSIKSLFVAECVGDLLIVDSSVENREHQQLIRNLMFAITGVPAEHYRFTPIDQQSLGSAQASLSEVAFGVVDRATMQNKTCRLLLLGDPAIRLFNGSTDSYGEQSLPGLSADVTVATSHSSAVLLSDPLLKRETWAHVQCLRKQ